MVTELLHRFRDKNRNLIDGGILGTVVWTDTHMTITSDAGNVLVIGGPTLMYGLEERGFMKKPSNPWE